MFGSTLNIFYHLSIQRKAKNGEQKFAEIVLHLTAHKVDLPLQTEAK